jgi:hypothetical protein
MRAKEFIVERRQVNEAFPILAVIPVVGSSLASMSVAALAWHLVNVGLGLWQLNNTWNDYQDKAEAFGPNVLQWPTEEREKIEDALMGAALMSLVGGLAPTVIRGVKAVFSKIPKEVKQEAMEKIAPKIEVELKKVIKKDTPAPGTKVTRDAPAAPGTPGAGSAFNQGAPKSAPATPNANAANIEKDRKRIMGIDADKQAELKKKLSGQAETPQEKLKRELLAKQAAKSG